MISKTPKAAQCAILVIGPGLHGFHCCPGLGSTAITGLNPGAGSADEGDVWPTEVVWVISVRGNPVSGKGGRSVGFGPIWDTASIQPVERGLSIAGDTASEFTPVMP
jgi:hypothetical protein